MFKVPEQHRQKHGPAASSEKQGNNGCFIVPFKSFRFVTVASDGEGWEHVSVSLSNRCPNWPEMCFIKDLFWGEEDEVVQFHPKKSMYVNYHPYCLHLWRPVAIIIKTPPSWMVGPVIEAQ